MELDWPKGQVNSLTTRFVWGTLAGGNFKWNLVTIVIFMWLGGKEEVLKSYRRDMPQRGEPFLWGS